MADVQVVGNKAVLGAGSGLNLGAGINPAQMASRLRQLPAGRKIGLLGLLAVVLTGIIAAFFLSAQPSFKPLYAGLADEDAGAVTAALAQLNIPYQISESGSAILVPAPFVHEARLKLATQGLPKGRIAGFEILDNQKMGVTQFQEQVNFQRALEGELTRTIQALGAVKAARVHLAIPKPSVFLRDQQKPTASVVVSLHAGRSLDRAQIQGIVHLISSSVPELSPRNVSVVDQNGNLLTNDQAGDSLLGASTTALQYSQTLEGLMTKRVVDMLAPVYGADNVRASVSADLDFSQVERSEETYKPNTDIRNAAIRSEQISEARDGDAQNPSGIPGVTSNAPPGASQAPIGGPRQGTEAPGSVNPRAGKRDATTNYELDRATTVTRPQVGAIKRLSVAVLINDKIITDEAGVAKLVPLTQDEINKISSLVREAIGFNEGRGDKVNVINQSFSKEATADLAVAQSAGAMAVDVAKSLATPLMAGAVALALIFGVMRPMLKSSDKTLSPGGLVTPGVGGSDSALQAAQGDATAGVRDPLLESTSTTAAALPAPRDDDGVAVEIVGAGDRQPVLRSATGEQRQVEEVRRIARENPQLVANIVKSWMEA
jgi:flagellar M-ring protein FliF